MLLQWIQCYKSGELQSGFGQDPLTNPSLFFAERARIIVLFHGPKTTPWKVWVTSIVLGLSERFKNKGLEESFIVKFLVAMFSWLASVTNAWKNYKKCVRFENESKKKIFNALNFIQQMLQIHYNPSVYIRKQMNNKDKMQLYIIQLIAI